MDPTAFHTIVQLVRNGTFDITDAEEIARRLDDEGEGDAAHAVRAAVVEAGRTAGRGKAAGAGAARPSRTAGLESRPASSISIRSDTGPLIARSPASHLRIVQVADAEVAARPDCVSPARWRIALNSVGVICIGSIPIVSCLLVFARGVVSVFHVDGENSCAIAAFMCCSGDEE